MRDYVVLPPRQFAIDEPLAKRLYQVLVEHGGAYAGADEEYGFVHAVSVRHTDEYRFQGRLGFGGKFRNNHSGVYVDCYPEDMTDDRRDRIARCNSRIKDILADEAP